MNKILISGSPDSELKQICKDLSDQYNKSFIEQDYHKAWNLIYKYPFPMYDQLVVDGPGYGLKDSFTENIYENYDVVYVNLLSLNIIAEAVMNDFNRLILLKNIKEGHRLRGTVAFSIQNFKHNLAVDLDNFEGLKDEMESFWKN